MGFELGRVIEAKPREFSPLPMGRYNAYVERTEAITSQNGSTGVEIIFRITADEYNGKYAGRSYIERLYLDGERISDEAKATRYGIIADIGAKIGLQSFTNTDALVNGELCLNITQFKSTWDGEERLRNRIQSYDYTDHNLNNKNSKPSNTAQPVQQSGNEMNWDDPF